MLLKSNRKERISHYKILFFLGKITYKNFADNVCYLKHLVHALFCFHSNCVYVSVDYKSYALLEIYDLQTYVSMKSPVMN